MAKQDHCNLELHQLKLLLSYALGCVLWKEFGILFSGTVEQACRH